MPRRVPNVRAVPWMVLVDVAVTARDHWQRLPERDRRELSRLVRKSKGRYAQLTPKEKRELRGLVGRLDLPGLGRDLLPFSRRLKRGR